MFPLLRPLVGTETEINPTRQPSQKPGIQFPIKGRKRPLCRARQTTVAHTLHMATNTATHTPMHTHMCTQALSHVRPRTHSASPPPLHVQTPMCPARTQICLLHTHAIIRTHPPVRTQCVHTFPDSSAYTQLWPHSLGSQTQSSPRCW